MDVSPSALLESGRALVRDYPGLSVHGLLADFEHQLGVLPVGDRRLTAFLGGTIGNLEPGPRAAFLADLRGSTAAGDWLLLGTDLVKDPAVLVPAYDDSAGVTARFNKNVLEVINRELAADFALDAYEHVALWDPDAEWIELRLRSTADAEGHGRRPRPGRAVRRRRGDAHRGVGEVPARGGARGAGRGGFRRPRRLDRRGRPLPGHAGRGGLTVRRFGENHHQAR